MAISDSIVFTFFRFRLQFVEHSLTVKKVLLNRFPAFVHFIPVDKW